MLRRVLPVQPVHCVCAAVCGALRVRQSAPDLSSGITGLGGNATTSTTTPTGRSSSTSERLCFCSCDFRVEQRRFQRGKPASTNEIGDALRCLGSGIDFDDKDLKKKYKELVKKHHPDMGGNEEMMKKVTTSYKLLTSLSKSEKMAYSQQTGRGPGGFHAPGAGFGPGNTPAYDTSHRYGTYSPRGQSAGRAGAYNTATGSGYRSSAYDFNSNTNASSAGYEQRPFTRRYSGAGGMAGTSYQGHSPHGRGNFSDPFGGSAFGFYRPGRLKQQMINLFLFYFLGMFLLSLVYRSYLDYLGDADWQRAEVISRSDTLNDLTQVREEIRHKLRERQKQYKQHADHSQQQGYNPLATQEEKNMRALEFANAQYQQQAWNKFHEDKYGGGGGGVGIARPTVLLSDKSRRDFNAFPTFDRRFGYTYHHAGEPIGVIYFEPSSKVRISGGTSLQAPTVVNPNNRFPQEQNLARAF